MIQKIKFTKANLERLCPTDHDYEVTDSDNKNLKARISTQGSKVFLFRKKYKGIDYKSKIGTFPTMSIEIARHKANEFALKVEQQIPLHEKSGVVQMTLEEEFYKYQIYYKNRHSNKINSIRKTMRLLEMYLKPLFKKKVDKITSTDINDIFEKITGNGHKAQANAFLRNAKAMFNVFIKDVNFKLPIINPCLDIRQHSLESRDRFVQPDEIPRLFSAFEKVNNIYFKNFFYLALYTGCRRNELFNLKWSDVIFEYKIIKIVDTKNKKPRFVPLVDEALEKLNELKIHLQNEYVFYSPTQKGHITEPKRVWAKVLSWAQITDLRIHDLRRTMASYQAINGVSMNIIGKSLGHLSMEATEVYSRLTLDPVRASMQTAINDIVSKSKISNLNKGEKNV